MTGVGGGCWRVTVPAFGMHPSSQSSMSGLISPKPVSYLQHTQQYNPYQRGVSVYSETPPINAPAPLMHPVPHQPGGQLIVGNAITSNLGIHEDTKIYTLVIQLM